MKPSPVSKGSSDAKLCLMRMPLIRETGVYDNSVSWYFDMNVEKGPGCLIMSWPFTVP